MKTFLADFKLGILSYGGAWHLIKEKKMWKYYLLPVLISLLLALGVFVLRLQVHDAIESLLQRTLHYDQWWDWAQWMTGWLIHLSLWILTWYLYYKFQKYILLIVLSPVLAYVSEKTEKALTGADYPFSWGQFFKDIVRGVLLAVRNFTLEMLITLGLFLLGLIPIFAPFTVIIALLVSWYYYGYSLMDYTNERHKLGLTASNRSIQNKKGIAIANGMVFEIIFLVPIIGFVVAPIWSTVAATVAMHDRSLKA